MHELSLVMDMLDRVNEISSREAKVNVVAIDVVIGDMSGVDSEAFRFAYSAATIDTVLAETKLRIRRTQGFDFQLESIEVQDV